MKTNEEFIKEYGYLPTIKEFIKEYGDVPITFSSFCDNTFFMENPDYNMIVTGTVRKNTSIDRVETIKSFFDEVDDFEFIVFE